jgi:four helix bundle protein
VAGDVTELKVYTNALELLPKVYLIVQRLPSNEEDLESQIKRAAKSISANIAEGFAKSSSSKEFKRYLLIALGSSDEVISHLRTIEILYPGIITCDLIAEYKVLSKRINTLHKNWR